VVVRLRSEPKKLSREQGRVLRNAIQRGEPLAVSAVSLVEIAVLAGKAGVSLRVPPREVLATIDQSFGFQIIPIDIDVALEVAALGDALRDPGDRTIVATARVHGLRLVTSDERIIKSKLVPVIE
jgi:PIN domain nuclease of toxin-antitoxin system